MRQPLRPPSKKCTAVKLAFAVHRRHKPHALHHALKGSLQARVSLARRDTNQGKADLSLRGCVVREDSGAAHENVPVRARAEVTFYGAIQRGTERVLKAMG